MNRKYFFSLPSSFTSIYLITTFFVISFISLLYLKYPQEYINHFDFSFIGLNTTRTTTTPLVVHDLVTNVSKTVVKPVVLPSSLEDLPLKKPPVFDIPVVIPSVDQFTQRPVVNFPVDGAVNSPTRGVNDAEVENHSQISPFDQLDRPVVNFPVDDTFNSPATRGFSDAEVENHSQFAPPVVDFPVDDTVNLPTMRGVNDAEGENHSQFRPYDLLNTKEGVIDIEADDNRVEDEDEDESSVMEYDQISFPPSHFTKEQRMDWIKQKIPESKILESTPRTRKFEFKIQQFVHTKRCRVNIFMTWISSTKFFGKREIFSLESITKAHPNACVIIISRIMATKTGRQIIQPLLDRGHMILTVAPDFPLLFQGTPAQDWFDRLKTGQVDPGTISLTENLSNLLRLVVLYKYGGIYFETDMILLKDVSSLKNTMGIQALDPEKKSWLSVNNAVLIFDKGHPLLLRFIEEFNSNFDGNNFGHNGPYMTSRIIEQVLQDPKYQFNVMSPMAFYPVGWLEIQHIFRNPNDKDSNLMNDNLFNRISRESYGVHLWENLSQDLKIEKGSVIGKLLSKNCILCHDLYDS